jgi:enamine deaminase RidA (YjgF/YER057c/UK114 family)
MNIDAKLTELGLTLPEAPKPIAAYVPSMRTGNLLFVSGQLPTKDGNLLATGPVPSATSIDAAQAAARQCVLNALAIVKASLGGDWSKLVKCVRVGAFIQSDPGFAEQAKVANGASELLQQIMGDPGRHARAAVGTNTLPLNASVEVEFLFEVK